MRIPSLVGEISMRMPSFRSALALIVSSFVLAACGGGAGTAAHPQSGTPDPIDTPTPQSPPPTSSGGDSGSSQSGGSQQQPSSSTTTQVNAPVANAGWDRAVKSGE